MLDYLDQWPYGGNAIMHGEPGLESAWRLSNAMSRVKAP
jgi:hypothetical protein